HTKTPPSPIPARSNMTVASTSDIPTTPPAAPTGTAPNWPSYPWRNSNEHVVLARLWNGDEIIFRFRECLPLKRQARPHLECRIGVSKSRNLRSKNHRYTRNHLFPRNRAG